MQRDNPVLTEDVLLTQQPFGESAERVGDSKWVYTAFDTEVRVSGTSLLYIVATGHNAFSPSATTGGEFLHTWPAAAGTWTPSSLPVQMPWELHGARFGYWTSTVTVSKVLADSSTVPSSNIARIRVDPGVLIVPIQAVLVLPNYPSPDLEAVMQQFDERSQGVLWDDRWRAKRQRTSHPGGLLSQVAGQWTYRSEVTRVIEPDDRKLNGISGLTMPDEVFDLCKIQFRLVSFHELRVDKELFELIREDGPDEHFLCDPAFEIRPRMFQLDAAASALPGVRTDLPRVLFNWTVQPVACAWPEPVVDVACDPEDSGCSDAGFVVVGLENLGVVNRDLVLAHELGHVLSMAHRPDAECVQSDSLMCGHVGSLEANLADKVTECAEARSWALKYRDAYFNGGN